MRNSFTLQHLECLLELQGVSVDKVVIISVLGKRPYNSVGPKINSLGRISVSKEITDDQEFVVDGAYDEENQVVYLHLCSLLDSDFMIKYYKQLSDKWDTKLSSNDFLSFYDEVKSGFARVCFILFYISHIVVFFHPGYTLDTNYIHYFKAVDVLSQKLANVVSEQLKSLENISREWINNGRCCTPRVIFYFEKCPKNIQNVKKLEHNLEDKIYNILKKSRIINSSGNSLFTIPLNDEFVYISEEGTTDTFGDAVRDLIADCQPGGGMILKAPFSNQINSEKNFKKFLQVHIQQARDKGFDDIMTTSRTHHLHSTHFELPILSHWIQATKIIYNVAVKRKKIISLCTDTRFSEQRCLKVLPLALARYQEGLPSHYGKAEHEARLSMALALFRVQARGPVFLQYVKQLETDCLAHWKNGKEQCEFTSLTGNPCKLPKHSENQEHISGVIYKSVCDCGRKIGPREDPYTAEQANYIFYHQIGQDCQCAKLERILFPTINQIENDVKQIDKEENTENSDATIEMLTLSTPSGLLPNYSSWSLVCLGASSLYSHNLGLSEMHHPGFLSSTNYLLPWDVIVYSNSKQHWPHMSKYAIRGRRGRPAGTSPQFTVKVFIGAEYECSSGHRFMLSGPERMLKATPGSIVKDTGHKIAESDMPLYFPCACRGGKLAQLMRLHVVTPKAPVYCTLDPKVQPASGSPIFISTTNGPIKLTQSAYWIMRLPYIYATVKETYSQNPSARLLQGVFGVTEIDQ